MEHPRKTINNYYPK